MSTAPFGEVTVITGPEDLLAERAVKGVVRRAAKVDPQADRSDIAGAGLDVGTLLARTGSSLFAARTLLVITDFTDAPSDVTDAIIDIAHNPLDDLALVVTHAGGQRGRGVLTKLKKAKATVVECPRPKAWEIAKFVEHEARSLGGRLDGRLSALLVESVGHDLRSLAAAVEQIFADADGPITEEFIHRYFGGRAETSGFAVADAALAGNANQALGYLRWSLTTGVAPVLITSALAGGVRGLAKLATTPAVGSDADVARDVGVPPWKLKSMRQQLRGWDRARLAYAINVVATVDADVKGAADDAEYALERAVLQISNLRRR